VVNSCVSRSNSASIFIKGNRGLAFSSPGGSAMAAAGGLGIAVVMDALVKQGVVG
jgi:hypothetical protein